MFQRLTQSRIALRLPLLIATALVLSIGASTWVYHSLFRTELELQTGQRARMLAEHAGTAYTNWLNRMFRTVEDLGEGHLAPDAMRRFNEALALQSPGWQEEVRSAYVERNPLPAGQRGDYDRGNSRPAYDAVHEAFNPYMRAHRDRFGYYDLFLITAEGDVVYNISKESDFAINLGEGALRDTELAQVWRAAMEGPVGTTSFSDFAPYAPSNGAPAAFVARQIVDHEVPGNPVIGVVALQLSEEGIGAALEAADLLDRDEIYVVAPDGTSRNASRIGDAFAMFGALPDLPQVTAARAGETAEFDEATGIHGAAAVVAVHPFSAHGNQWSAVVELDQADAFAALTDFNQRAMIVVAIGVLLSLAIGWAVARSITRPLGSFSLSMQALVDKRYDLAITGTARRDEIGGLFRGLDLFRQSLSAAEEAAQAQERGRAEQSRVVADLGRGLRDLASGHLDMRLDDPYSAGYEKLRTDFNATVDTMETLMRTIAANASEIRSRAEEISASSDDLSHRTETQAATLEETAAALDELTASVRAAAESASEVETVVADARKEAEKSGQVVSEAVAAMSLIRKSSTEISQIIGVIDDIAFQTNLLALNAGVEAARAGDAGRGFAVVASEVRALAQRSSEAAKQIKILITGSTEQVETGVGLVGRAGETLTMIIQRVGNIDQLIGGIANGAREQSSGLQEINVGVSQLDQVTQQNAAMVEQVTAASVTLKNESLSLSQVVARFRVRNPAEGGQQPVHLDTTPLAELTPRPAADLDLEQAFAERAADELPPAFPIAANTARWQDF
ncbi:methyl-accepting chemotaxis protein [Pararhodobacter aggregans]|uniref:Methyl-accepting chemotaxis protein n=1 Tax=Pararhodobacter aggregans TaxID=404875 RepID=A0A2T7USB3_9RHOB|nr:methyl-accepting chemotaxis protein [Pararhodobacter aggregans]PTX00193.1 methyl-accepting chemotaxis protein [Pararhodobacter aggregans]PVE47519.1 methyl-accepting chemotaxis protein [Pararhodobacter aggregans]